MAVYPNAEQRIWKPYDPERFITPRAVVLHTNAVDSEDPGSTGGLSWHFQVGEHGAVYQHRDTETRAAANAGANEFAISIETWDGGDPEGNPWNQEQLDALHELISWCCDTHGIPRSQITSAAGSGVGYHRMFAEWDIPYHSCPGNTRAAQFPGILARLASAPQPSPLPEDDMGVRAIAYHLGHTYAFKLGDDGQVWYSVDHAGFMNTIPGGLLGSAPTSTVDELGRLVVGGKGHDDDNTWCCALDKGAWTAWFTL